MSSSDVADDSNSITGAEPGKDMRKMKVKKNWNMKIS